MTDSATPMIYHERWAWVVPPNIVAVPFVHGGYWWIVDLHADECCTEPVLIEEICRWARERRADIVRARTVGSAPYYLNPWPTVFDAFVEGAGDDWIPGWFDRRPITQIRDLNAGRRLPTDGSRLLGTD